MGSDLHLRIALIERCQFSFVQQDRWLDRDSASSQGQVGRLLALLSAGCDFRILRGGMLVTDDETIWIEVTYKGFGDFEEGREATMTDTFYLPTDQRLARADGGDWY